MAGSCAGSATSSSISRPTCTLATPSKPSAGSARSTAWPWGSRIPSFGLTRMRARTLCARPLDPAGERLAGDPLVGLDVLLARACDHLVGDRRRGRVAVPPGRGRPVAHVLLVEARLAPAGRILVGGPEARGVRRAHLIAEGQGAVPVEAELELGVGQDDPPLAGVLGGELVDRDRDLAHPLGQLPVAHELGCTLEVDVLVVALERLGGGGEDRLGKPV